MNENKRYFGSVRFFKNMILVAVIIMITVPTVWSICLANEINEKDASIESLTAQVEALNCTVPAINTFAENESQDGNQVSDEWAVSPYADLYPDFYAPQEFAATTVESSVVYLTFDDGPSARTAEVLDILKEKDARATFFVVGNSSDEAKTLLNRIVDEGHTLAMHSNSHKYTQIYASVEDYLADMYEVFTLIKETTGTTPTLFRFPGGSINNYNTGIYEDLISEMLRRGFVPYDWNISSQDAAGKTPLPADTIFNNVISGASGASYGIVLMHDSGGKTTTVQALAPMIDKLREMGFELRALTPDVKPMLFGYRNASGIN